MDVTYVTAMIFTEPERTRNYITNAAVIILYIQVKRANPPVVLFSILSYHPSSVSTLWVGAEVEQIISPFWDLSFSQKNTSCQVYGGYSMRKLGENKMELDSIVSYYHGDEVQKYIE